MRLLPLAYLCACASIACSFSGTGVTATSIASAVDTDTDATTTTTTTTSPADTTSDPPTPTTTGDPTGPLCQPGSMTGCVCPAGGLGMHTCNPDGLTYGPCEGCPEGTTTTEGTTTPVDPDTTLDPDSTTVDSDTTTGKPDPESTSSTTEPDETTGTTAAETTIDVPLCIDLIDEPLNDAKQTAVEHSGLDCQDGAEQIDGILDGDADVDWFRFQGAYPMDCPDAPTVEVTLTADPAVELCVYGDCVNGNNNAEFVDCFDGSTPASSMPADGCCRTGGGFTFHFDCTGMDDSAEYYIKLSGAPADACVDYTVTYDFQ